MKSFTYTLCCLLLVSAVGPVQGYVDISPTLGNIIKDADTIAVFQIDKIQFEKRIILFKKVADLKGKFPHESTKHHLASGYHPREPKMVLEWAEPGKNVVAFISGKTTIVCTGRYWYQCSETADNWWTMNSGRPELSLAYYGRADQLRSSLIDILAGKEVVIPAVNHGARMGVWQYSNVAFQKVLRGKDCPVWRIKASLEMPNSVWEIGEKDSRWVVGPGAVSVDDIPQLIKGLTDKDKDDRQRSQAAIDLGLIGWKAQAAVPALRAAFKDPSPLVRLRAARAVSLIAEDYDAPVRLLAATLKDPTPTIRRQAAEAIGDLGAAAKLSVPALREMLKDTEPNVRWAAAEALGRMGPAAAAAVPALAEALRDKEVRVIAADALGSMGAPARGAIPVLTDALKDSDEEFRWTSAVALSRIDAKSAKVAMPLFIEKLQHADLRARWDAMMYITPMGKEAKDAAPAVLAMVKRGNGVAAATLAAIAGPDAEEALPVLFHVLADDWDTSRDIAKVGKAAIPGLHKLLKDPEAKGKHHLVIKSLGFLCAKCRAEVMPTLIESLASPDAAVRKAAAVALGTVDPDAVEALPALRKCVRDADPGVRLAIADTLRVIQESEAAAAVKPLTELLTHKDPEIRREAALTLGEIGADATDALTALRVLQKDATETAVRSAAAWSIARITTAEANREAIAVMIEALKDEDPTTRRDAARHLSVIGPAARSALKALGVAKLDDDESVRRAAMLAMTKINVKPEPQVEED